MDELPEDLDTSESTTWLMFFGACAFVSFCSCCIGAGCYYMGKKPWLKGRRKARGDLRQNTNVEVKMSQNSNQSGSARRGNGTEMPRHKYPEGPTKAVDITATPVTRNDLAILRAQTGLSRQHDILPDVRSPMEIEKRRVEQTRRDSVPQQTVVHSPAPAGKRIEMGQMEQQQQQDVGPNIAQQQEAALKLDTAMAGNDPAALGQAIEFALGIGIEEDDPLVSVAIDKLRQLLS